MAGTATKKITIQERCAVAPVSSAPEMVLPLTYFDVLWLYFHPVQRLLFYRHPCSADNFLETVVPNLKHSLAQALAHYLPLAGRLFHPLDFNSGRPDIRYAAGYAVQVTFATVTGDVDFDYLTGDHLRSANEFYRFVPDWPEPQTESDLGFRMVPVLAIQVTNFPETGVCIGVTNHHIAGDASSIVGFIKAWSSISRLGDLPETHPMPVFDRSGIKDPSGRANIYMNQLRQMKLDSPKFIFTTNNVRATFTLQKHEILDLRDRVLARFSQSHSLHLSSFAITTAYVWSCLVKSASESGEEVDDDEPEYFGFAVDARRRMDPPLPEAYFGNAVGFVVVESSHGVLRSADGFFVAVELVAEIIRRKANVTGELLSDADEWLVKLAPLLGKRLLGVAGSPRFDLYGADFGWGKAVKYEVASVDRDGSMSLCKSRQFEGGLEIGLSQPEKKMEAFVGIFSGGEKPV